MISFVIPVYNEEKGFKKFYTEMLLPELKKLKYGYELILVNDGSKDKSLQIIQELAEKDKHIKVLSFSRSADSWNSRSRRHGGLHNGC